MIRYDLKCGAGCAFEAWFQSAAAFDREAEAGRLECPYCGDRAIKKALMAPAVRSRRSARPAAESAEAEAKASHETEAQTEGAPSNAPERAPAPATAAAEALVQTRKERAQFMEFLAKARRMVEDNTRDVGRDFASLAQKMHEGDIEHESIRGRADRKEAEALKEAGVPFGVLPDFSDDTVN